MGMSSSMTRSGSREAMLAFSHMDGDLHESTVVVLSRCKAEFARPIPMRISKLAASSVQRCGDGRAEVVTRDGSAAQQENYPNYYRSNYRTR